MFDEDFEYWGDCYVCHDPVDEKDADNCDCCGNVFHGSSCGDWHDEKYICRNCDDKK